MAKLPKENQFLDLSDYGRPVARLIAQFFKPTFVTPIHVTILFIISGLLAIACIFSHHYLLAAFFLILKSILDAADGELARIKNTPSYTGRYFDSVADIILNFLFLLSISMVTNGSFFYMILAFVGIQLQGTLYNYYYVILRNKFNGDTTSRVFETQVPKAMKGEKQSHVNVLFGMYNFLYKIFDQTIYQLDKKAILGSYFPNWFMTLVSSFGLGFQLLIMSFFLVLNLDYLIIPFFIFYTLLIPSFIFLRQFLEKRK
ncbi:MAG: CDP-alcohol phosphatidyltransferase family protein [Saprospiraceae bacterium]